MRPRLGKDKIIEAAITCFRTHGYHPTSVSEIAQAAGVSKGLMYNYFPSKEALLKAILQEATGRMEKIAAPMNNGALNTPYAARLRAFLDGYGAFLRAEQSYLAFQLSLLVQPDLKPIVAEELSARAAHLFAQTEALVTAGGWPDPTTTTRRLLAELDGIGLHFLAIYEEYPLEAALDALFEGYKDPRS